MNEAWLTRISLPSYWFTWSSLCVLTYTHIQFLQAFKNVLVPFSFLNCQECITAVSRLSVHFLTIKGYKLSGTQVQQAEQSIKIVPNTT